ncbi:polymerase 14 [Seminavis robusta]|uniref:Poly [ADP-ribose] polymerase n=1 Tax=Seminavis robusta TaxID=568900 RepID=A0A9N8E9W3_9STRA|nr:polymerase 14 [Seminavis robusta]|eukprot:Sro668_g184380.1 polymerase 14 (208) ;mRNA; f:37718-38341
MDSNKDGLIDISNKTQEYMDVIGFFLSSMGKKFEKDQVSVRKLQRVQSESQWQQYAIKIGTMREHFSQKPGHLVNNKDVNGLEQRWLFHGTAAKTVPKIVKQNFNRSFAGQNGVKFGSGVYFAANAPFACNFTYPDEMGHHHMFLCRVAVGDWCKGSKGQKVPDSKPWSQHELFDSTVDNVYNPSIFVAYHDAQAYPEYLVSFKLKQ